MGSHSCLALVLKLVLLFCYCNVNALEFPLGDVRNCLAGAIRQGQSASHLDVLPGLGFDNLRNVDLGQVLAYNYSTCKVSGDGSYLMPDSVVIVPVQESKVDKFAEYFSTFLDYTPHTAASINFQANSNGMFSSTSGSFSADFQKTKSTMYKHDSNSARVSLRYKFYTAHITGASDAQLHPAFKSRLLDIAANIQNNNTKLAHYLAETLVRDYGTHVITSIDAGAGLSQTTFVSQKFLQHMSEGERSLAISENAGAGFLFWSASESLDASYSHYHQFKDQFNYNTTSSHVFSYGGPIYKVGNFSLTDWENGVADHLVAIDRSGVPLYSVINTNNVPELPDSTLLTVMDYVYKAVTKYYKVNTIAGCMDSSSPKFNFQANVDDGSCDEEKTAHFFGGMYQTCTPKISLESIFCDDFKQTNPITQDYSCSTGYEAILLHTNEGSKYETVHVCKKHCAFLGFFCRDDCWTYRKLHLVTYHTYWCSAQQQNSTEDVGLMFGGVYTLSQQNPLTGSRTCPPYFYPLHFGDNIYVCVNDDDPQGSKYSVPFGGFHSCSNGNPLVSTKKQFQNKIYPHRCGKHYHQFLITIDEGCEIYYCADVSAIMKQQPHPPRLPPYHALPRMSHNVTNTLIVKGNNGRVWIKNEDGAWVRYRDGQQTSQEYLMSLAQEAAGPPPSDDDETDNNKGGSIGIMIGVVIGSVASTILVGALIALLVFGIRKAKSASRSKRILQSGNNSSSAYLVINDESDTTAHRNSHGSTDSAV